MKNDAKPTTAPRVAAVVLNWNAAEKTRRCLQALAELDGQNLHIVLVDNGCTDFRDADFSHLPQLSYVHSPANLGFAGGCNLGAKRALDAGARYLWFVNNDAEPHPDSLATMLALAEAKPTTAILGPKILQRIDPTRIDSLALDLDLPSGRFRLVGHDEIDRGQHDHLADVTAVTGCAMLVRAAAFQSAGGFDERYFLYLEDTDLCLRLRALGHGIACVPTARVFHDRSPANADRQSVSSLYYTARNHFLLLAVHAPGGTLRATVRRTRVLLWNLAFALRGDPRLVPARLGAVLSGIRDYAAGRFGERPAAEPR